MKRIILILFSMFFALSFTTGCTAATVFNFTSEAWAHEQKNVGGYERTVYHVVRTDSLGAEIAAGTLTYTIYSTTEGYFTSSDLLITYTSGDFAGKTDKSYAEVISSSASDSMLMPVSVKKIVNYETDSELNLFATADYKDGLKIKTYTDESFAEEVQEINFTSKQLGKNVFDNEQLLLLNRANSNFAAGANLSYQICSIYDTVKDSVLTKFAITVSIASEAVMLKPEGTYFDQNPNFENGLVRAYETSIAQPNGMFGNRGPALKVVYSDKDIQDPATKDYCSRVLLKYVQESYDLSNNTKAYETTYTIKSLHTTSA